MLDRIPFIKNLNWRSDKVKTAVTFLVTFVVSLLMTPGLLFEYGQQKDKRRVNVKTGAVHSVVVSAVLALLFYFYLRK